MTGERRLCDVAAKLEWKRHNQRGCYELLSKLDEPGPERNGSISPDWDCDRQRDGSVSRLIAPSGSIGGSRYRRLLLSLLASNAFRFELRHFLLIMRRLDLVSTFGRTLSASLWRRRAAVAQRIFFFALLIASACQLRNCLLGAVNRRRMNERSPARHVLHAWRLALLCASLLFSRFVFLRAFWRNAVM